MTPLQMVREFVKLSGQKPNKEMSLQLVKEEYLEWREAVMTNSISKEDELKELADMIYVIYGYANAMSWDLDKALSRVHYNNCERMTQDDGTILRRKDGKIIKNPNTPKINLKDLVNA